MNTFLAAFALLAATPGAQPILADRYLALAPQAPAAAKGELTLDDLYPERSVFGKTAVGMAFSHDDRYLAFLWNPYEDKGMDLWIHDTRTGKRQRLTSLELMTDFDRDAIKILERYRAEKQEEERRKGLSQEERRKLEEEDKKKREEKKTPDPDYAGISAFEWANGRDELLFTYRGDIYRHKIGEAKPTRITRTRDNKSSIKYAKDDSGFFFRQGNGVFRVRFDSPAIEQLNPELPHGMQMGGYSISPCETKIMVSSGRSTGTNRNVSYIVYRDRFAEARTVQRGVADDEFRHESYLFLYDLNDDPKANPKHDGKPWQIYHWPAGKEWGETSLAQEPWSPDGRKFVFTTWKRDKRELDVVVADLDKREVTAVFTDKHTGGHTTPSMTRPFFTRDGSKIVALLEKSGYRHAWLIDPVAKGATQLTRGEFEVYPQRISKDGKTFLATSSREDVSTMDAYLVDLADGAMRRLTSRRGTYGVPAVSNGGDQFALNHRSWTSMNELYLLAGGKETAVTDSHSDKWPQLNRISPKQFSFRNRHGHTIHGYMYLPPDFQKTDRRPLFMYTYGGPLGTGKDVVDGNFHNFNMYMAYRHGYITCSIDTRGMSTYGGMFESASWDNPGKAQTEDLTDAVKWFVENYNVDPEKVGLNGWSFGGWQTQHAMYTEPDVFKLGIAGAGPTEWQNYNTWYTGGVIGFSNPGKPEDLDKHSLTKIAKNLKGNLLLLHGVEDTNVLFQDTVKVYQALLRAGKGPQVELVIDPTGGHGLGGDIKTVDRYKIYEAYLLKHWGPYRRP
jgi:dipeptidyl-peptidase 4